MMFEQDITQRKKPFCQSKLKGIHKRI